MATPASRASDFLAYNEQQFGDPYAMKTSSTTALGSVKNRNFTTGGVLMDKPVREVTRVHIEPGIKFRRPDPDTIPRPTSPGHTSEFFLGNYTTPAAQDRSRNTSNLFQGPGVRIGPNSAKKREAHLAHMAEEVAAQRARRQQEIEAERQQERAVLQAMEQKPPPRKALVRADSILPHQFGRVSAATREQIAEQHNPPTVFHEQSSFDQPVGRPRRELVASMPKYTTNAPDPFFESAFGKTGPGGAPVRDGELVLAHKSNGLARREHFRAQRRGSKLGVDSLLHPLTALTTAATAPAAPLGYAQLAARRQNPGATTTGTLKSYSRHV